jgi:hypothetical protein
VTRAPGSPTAPALFSRAGVVGLAALLLVALVGVTPASAHGAADGVRYVLDDLAPTVDGLTVQVVRGLGPQLVLGNDTGEEVEVLDDAGRPFLRIGPEGVEGNVASPSWRASDRPYELGGGDPDADEPVGDEWVRLGDDPSWGWYDHRLHERELVVPPDASGPVELDAWEVPLRVGGRDVVVAGRTLGGPPLGFVAPRLAVDRQPADGLTVTLLPGAVPGLLVRVDEGHDATVVGAAGEPFLRFGGGVVEVNAASPTWHRVGGTGGDDVAVDGAAAPAWRQVAASQQFAWVEPRATVPEVEGNPADGEVLASWVVPVVADGQEVPLVGELVWTRTAVAASGDAEGGGGGVPWPNLLLAVAGVGAVVALLLVRRRR